ncbi:hypothetical protein HQ560_15090 [bacterium]|nr:hypothetical protein [bacterium]
MLNPTVDKEELARKGQKHYDTFLRTQLEPAHRGEYLCLDVESGDYEVDANQLVAMQRARARHPGAVHYIVRIGYPAVGRIGARVHRRTS